MNKKLLEQNRAGQATSAPAQAAVGRRRRMKCLLLSLLLLCATLPLSLRAQDLNVSGTVTDADGSPLVGVSVVLKGSTRGATTDASGSYSINAPADATLVFSFLGLTSKEEVIAGRGRIDVTLSEDNKALEEVVVVGYGTMRKKDLTGSITQIRPDRLADENPKTVQDILRGTPGLNVGYDASAKGGGSMQIRGQRSVYTDGGHNDPLLILDGMLFYGELSEINPDDIAQIDILKDASAAAIYGAKAANGVIIISTKKGKAGKPVVNVSSNIGFTTKSAYRGEVYDPEGYMQYREDWQKRLSYAINPATGQYEPYQVQQTNAGYYEKPENLSKYGISLEDWRAYTTNAEGESDASIYAKRLGLTSLLLENYLAGRTYDWYDNTFRTGFNQDYNASVSGASERMNYYLSFGYLQNEGAVKGNEYSAVRSNIKVEGKVTKWLEVGANINFQDRSDGDIQVGLGTDYWNDNEIWNSPYASHHDADGKLVYRPMGDGPIYQYNYDFNRQYEELEKGYTIFNTILNAKVTLPFNITYSFNAAPRWQYFYDRWFLSADHPARMPLTGRVNREQTTRFDWSLNNTLAWEQTFAEKHRVSITLVQEAEERSSWLDRIEAYNILPTDALGFHNTGNAGKSESSFWSTDTHQTADALLGRLFYSYDDRYMLTASVRRDGYSAFGQNNPYATFPSVALGWSFVNEEFFTWKDVMSSGKLRVSYGKNGNRSLEDPYVSLANLSGGTGSMQGYVDASNSTYLVNYLIMSRLANPNLQWEKTTAWNFGLDFGFLNDRITGSLEYYVMNTNDMIMAQRLPDFSGFSSITTNLGEVQNRGIEIAVNSLNIKNDILEWSTTLGFSYNKNEIKHLYYENEDILDEAGNITGSKEMDDSNSGWFIGQPISAIWNYRVTGIWQVSELEEAARYGQKPGDPKVANTYTADDIKNDDGTTTPVYNDKDKEFLGQTAPPIHWSLRNDFTFFKSLSFSFNIYSYMGHKSTETYYLNNDNGGSRVTGGYNIFVKEYWTPENPSDTYARLDASGPTGAVSAPRLHDRSFIRLENISLGYTLPKAWTSKLLIEKAKVYGSIRNVGVWQKDWEYGDPETGGLATRIFSLGLNLTF